MMLLVGWLVSRVYKYVAFSTLSDKACLAVVYMFVVALFSTVYFVLSLYFLTCSVVSHKKRRRASELTVCVCV